MSAFICTDAQFATVARWLFTEEPIAQRFADHLKRENVRSVNYRYKEKTRVTRVNMNMAVKGYSIHDIAAMLACINYQSCEHPTYDAAPLQLAQRLLLATGADTAQSDIWGI